jgi:DNA-binding transcriptional regulator YiaG
MPNNWKKIEIEEDVITPTTEGGVLVEKIKVPACQDPQTNKIYIDGEALLMHDDIKARHLGIISTNEIKKIRQQLNCTPLEISQLLQIEEKTWTRWESGRERPSRPINLLLRALLKGKINATWLKMQPRSAECETAQQSADPATPCYVIRLNQPNQTFEVTNSTTKAKAYLTHKNIPSQEEIMSASKDKDVPSTTVRFTGNLMELVAISTSKEINTVRFYYINSQQQKIITTNLHTVQDWLNNDYPVNIFFPDTTLMALLTPTFKHLTGLDDKQPLETLHEIMKKGKQIMKKRTYLSTNQKRLVPQETKGQSTTNQKTLVPQETKGQPTSQKASHSKFRTEKSVPHKYCGSPLPHD